MTSPIPPLRREVEPPRPPVGPWMPLSLLGTATMLTLATAFGVMTRMPHDVPTTPAPEPPAALDDARISWLWDVVYGPRQGPAKGGALRPLERYMKDSRELDRRCDARFRDGTLVGGTRTHEICVAVAERPRGCMAHRAISEKVNARLESIAVCMREWDERSPGTAATVTAGFRVTRDGRVENIAMTGLDDRIVPACIKTQLQAMELPAHSHVTAVEVDVKYIEGQTRVATLVLGGE